MGGTNKKVTAPFGQKSKVDDQAEEYVQNKTDRTVADTDAEGDKAASNTKDLKTEQQETDKSTLDPNANKNIAKGQGTYDMFNNRNYSTTLRLAREADAYNNKPVDHIIHQGSYKGSGIRDLGVGYDRPNIETMETRAMQQAQQLDTNQKMLAQALQDAVNHKDLDAFIQCYKQLYNIQLDKMQAAIEMRRFSRQLEVQQMMTKSMAQWQSYFTRAFSAETAATIMNMVEDNPMYAQYLSYALTGQGTPAQEEYVASTILTARYNDLVNQGVSAVEAFEQATRELNNTYLDSDNIQAAANKQRQKIFGKKGTWAAKGKAKQEGNI